MLDKIADFNARVTCRDRVGVTNGLHAPVTDKYLHLFKECST